MFSQRNLKALFLGSLGLLCAIAFNACTPNQASQNPSLENQAVAMVQPPMTGTEINERLRSILPPLDKSEVAEANAQTWTEPASASSSPSKTSLANPEPVPISQTVTPVPRTPAPVTSVLAVPAPVVQTTSIYQSQAIASQASGKIAFNSGGSTNTQYGHYPYAEAFRENLTVAGYYGSRPEQLHKDAAQAFKQMQAAAAQDGVQLMAVSGFRDVGIQSELFSAQTARQGSPALAARISAPPGHSEHHTGFAIDVGDEGYPETDIEVTFEQTPAFNWMAQNAASYGFELSFPRNNNQGVNYEPWHWRFVGSTTSRQIFAQAR